MPRRESPSTNDADLKRGLRTNRAPARADAEKIARAPLPRQYTMDQLSARVRKSDHSRRRGSLTKARPEKASGP